MTNPCVNARRHLADGEHDGTQADDGYLCRSCTRRLEQRIAELPALCSWLKANVGRGLGSQFSDSRGGSETPIPINAKIMALLGYAHDCSADACHENCTNSHCPPPHDPLDADDTPSIPWTLWSWIRLILDEQPTFVGPRDTSINNLTMWFLARLPWVVEQRWVDELILEIDRLCSIAHGAAPWQMEPLEQRRRPVPCKFCDLLTLVWIPGGTGSKNRYPIECVAKIGGCGRLYTGEEYEQWLHMLDAVDPIELQSIYVNTITERLAS